MFNRSNIKSISDICDISQYKMSLAAVQDELKTLLRGLLISSPRAMTIDELQRDYRLQEGQDVPFHKLGYKSFLEYLKSVPDTVVVSFVYYLR
jgi:hypothetical protein